ncbi:MAG: SRPBCC domain-containing protein [Armatimonadetes bacterium]|nr:SRPBCC domain-containing protein [Armatimonadota bacterium]
MTDTIIRELVLPATPEAVWAKSFGSPAALSTWFPERIEGEFVLGEPFVLVWGEHRSQCRLTEFTPARALSYQWHPGDAFTLDDHPAEELTTVRFMLEPTEGGTKVTMTESGFERIAESRRAWAFGQNNGGWDEELAKLPLAYSA